jgi:hypothetical protein
MYLCCFLRTADELLTADVLCILVTLLGIAVDAGTGSIRVVMGIVICGEATGALVIVRTGA